MERLPCCEMYEKSYMHRDHVTCVQVSQGFVMTASRDGIIKFWKKKPGGIEFAKQFRAHTAAIVQIAVDASGFTAATLGLDRTVKYFDVINFDMVDMIELEYQPQCIELVTHTKTSQILLAAAHDNLIKLYKDKENNATFENHSAKIVCIRYNHAMESVVSTDVAGHIEIWDAECQHPVSLKFRHKIDTDLYVFAKVKTIVTSVTFNPSGTLMLTMSQDRIIRLFRFASGKLLKIFDDTLASYEAVQQNGDLLYKLDAIDFGRRIAIERELEKQQLRGTVAHRNVIFDDSGNFFLYASMHGIRIVNVHTGAVNLLGKVENTDRFLHIALYQGIPRETDESAAASAHAGIIMSSESAIASRSEDPTIFACAWRKERFFCFSNREPDEHRDILNERPSSTPSGKQLSSKKLSTTGMVVIHTTKGDITVQLYMAEAPKACENFLTHAQNGYYNDVIWHRVIKEFMIQTGDPLGDGTGGESIWGKPFEDEFHINLRHDKAGIVSLANAGPNTNGSQFFITCASCSWLDNKHTVFGTVVRGLDIVHSIERVKVDKNNRPFQPIKILNISMVK